MPPKRIDPADMPHAGLFLCWIYAIGESGQERMGIDRRNVSPQEIYAPLVLQRLLLARAALGPRFAHLTTKSPVKSWSEATEYCHRKAVGLALVASYGSVGIDTLLDYGCRISYDYFQRTKYQCQPLLTVSVIDIMHFDPPQEAFSNENMGMTKGMFFHLTQASSERMLALNDSTTGMAVRDVIQAWGLRYNNGTAIPTDNPAALGSVLLGVKIPAPHVLLLPHKSTNAFTIPVPRNKYVRNTGMRFDLGARFLRGIELLDGHRPADGNLHWNPLTMLRTADFLRAGLLQSEKLQLCREEVLDSISILTSLRESALDTTWRASEKAFRMEHLISCLMVSGSMKAAKGLGDIMVHSIRAAVPDKVARQYYEDLLTQARAVPSADTIIRHRMCAVSGSQSW